jgi:hypothetical protein
VDRDQPNVQEVEVTLVVQVWLAGLLSSITRLLASARRAAKTTVHPTEEATLFTGAVPLSDTTGQLVAWPQR